MKNATITISSVFVSCPECGSSIENDSGSEMWDFHDVISIGRGTIECKDCGAKFKLPKLVADNMELP